MGQWTAKRNREDGQGREAGVAVAVEAGAGVRLSSNKYINKNILKY